MASSPFQHDLFCSEAIPFWLPDESVYSLASRFTRTAGHNSSKTTGRLLFGHPRRGYQHDFAAGLTHLSKIAQGRLGTPTAIALQHSIAPYFVAFASSVLREEVLSRMSGTQIGALKYTLGLLTSGLRASHPLKGCASCEQEDKARYGVAYWHIEHQYPTSFICLTHREPLWFELSKSDGCARFEWLLPDDVPAASRHRIIAKPTTGDTEKQIAITKMSSDLVRASRIGSVIWSELQQKIRSQLHERHLLTPKQTVKRIAAARSYIQTNGWLASIDYVRGLPSDDQSAARQLDRVLRADSPPAHPARVVCLLSWLWPSWDDFVRQEIYRITIPTEPKLGRAQSDNFSDQAAEDFIGLIQSGASISRAARSRKISIAMGQRLAAEAGKSVSRRPKVMTARKRRAITSMAKDGRSKHDIAEIVGLSAQTVMRFLSTNPELKRLWVSRRKETERCVKRQEWSQAISSFGVNGVNAVRMEAPAVYAWLYRNDRQWLTVKNASLPTARRNESNAVDWNPRDKVVVAEIQTQCGLEGGDGNLTIPVSLGRLCEHVPELRAKIRRLDRLPRTRHLLAQILEA